MRPYKLKSHSKQIVYFKKHVKWTFSQMVYNLLIIDEDLDKLT